MTLSKISKNLALRFDDIQPEGVGLFATRYLGDAQRRTMIANERPSTRHGSCSATADGTVSA